MSASLAVVVDERIFAQTATGAQAVQRAAARDREQPGLHRAALDLEPLRLSPRLPERFFHDVLHVIRRLEHSRDHAVDDWEPAVVERAQRALVLRTHATHQLGVHRGACRSGVARASIG